MLRCAHQLPATAVPATSAMRPPCALPWRRFCAPREVVLLRTWRRDPEDGTYIVLYQVG